MAENGTLQLVAVYKDIFGNPIENTAAQPLSIQWRVQDETIATVDKKGLVSGNQLGTTMLQVTITDINTDTSHTLSVRLKVALVSVRKIFINPRVATLPPDESKTFTVIGIDSQGAPEILESSKVSFRSDPDFVSVSKHFDSQKSQIKVTANALKGYTFIVPEYTEADQTITGDPLLIQIQAMPQPNKPSPELSGGKLIDFNMLDESGPPMALVHSDGEKIFYQYFDPNEGAWTYKDLDKEEGQVSYLQIDAADDIIRILGVVDSKMMLWTTLNGSGAFARQELADGLALNGSNKVIDMVKLGDDLLILYYIGQNDKELTLMKITSDNTVTRQTLLSDVIVKSLDIVTNARDELRFVLYIAENLYYVADIGGSYYWEEVYTNDSIQYPTIGYDSKNNPYVAFFKESDNKVIVNKRDGGLWLQDTIAAINFGGNGLDTEHILHNVRHISMEVDRYDAPRIVMIDAEDIYYMKQFMEGSQLKWRIDKITDGEVGDHLSVLLDEKNRARLFYEDRDLQWVKYWNEPIYFDYRDPALDVDSRDDTPVGSDALELLQSLHLACRNRVCGSDPYDSSVNCGNCSSSYYCTDEGACENACTGRECGTSAKAASINCGECGSDSYCTDTGTCEDACADIVCGPSPEVTNVNCGACSSGDYCTSAGRCEDACYDRACGTSTLDATIDCGTCGVGNYCTNTGRCEDLNVTMVAVSGGTFEMGCSPDDDYCFSDEWPRRTVTVPPFTMSAHEVTQGEWIKVMGSNPAHFSHCGDDCPVEQVSWNDVQDFIAKLNRMTGANYRLPTEAEWEYAARADTNTKWPCGNYSDCLDEIAWYYNSAYGRTHPIEQKLANTWGLYDMHGNVWEWVQDRYDNDAYDWGDTTDPQGPGSGMFRVIRGGGWNSVDLFTRSSHRSFFPPSSENSNLGFRLVLE
ncbi:MAG: SUMF1/EgtB/PvdO family nonheme iron enzyme [Deltaproteobacteria bacterium]|nr:SUMF1/EgtB/PvdO family nonheme iron enzyme [Deltaproteobacteria bacterium]